MIRILFYLSIVLLLFFGSCTSKTVDKKEIARNDSIQKYLDLVVSDTIAYDKSIFYNNKAYSFINLKKNDSLTRYYLYCVSYRYSLFSKNKELKTTAKRLMTLSLKSGDSLNIARAYRNLGLYHMAISQNEYGIACLFKAKRIFKSLQRMDYVIKVMNDIATTQYYACDFLGSNRTLIEIILLSEKANFKKISPSVFNSIGNNLFSLKNYNEAIKYYKKVIKNNKYSEYNNLSNCYIAMGNYNTALEYLSKNLNDKKLLIIDPPCYARALSLNALIQLKKGQYYKLKEKFFYAEDCFRGYNSPYGRNYNQIYLSMYYEKINDTVNAVNAAETALLLSKKYKNPLDILESFKQLIKVDKKNIENYVQQYINVSDSMQITERNFRDKFARITFETDEIIKQKETAIKEKWIICAVLGVIIFIVILLLIITRQQNKQKDFRLLHEQQKANEEIYHLMLNQRVNEEQARQAEKKRIALELHDGVMNKLASTRLNLDILNHKKDEQTIERCLIHVADIYKIEQEIRSIAHDLTLEDFNTTNSFVSLIGDLIITQNSTSNTQYRLEMDESIDWKDISSSIKMNTFRIIQEASHNINKFAHAKSAIISLILDNNNLCLSVTDNGEGFDTEIETDGIGLKNIRQRVEALNGKLVIQSIKNKSTFLNIAIPLA